MLLNGSILNILNIIHKGHQYLPHRIFNGDSMGKTIANISLQLFVGNLHVKIKL